MPSNYMIIDKKSNLKMQSDNFSFSTLVKDLYKENEITDTEKCVVLLQMLTYVGEDLYDQFASQYEGECDRKMSEQFIKDNDSFIDY